MDRLQPRQHRGQGAWAKAGLCAGTIVWVTNYGYVDSVVGNPPKQAIKQAFR